MTYRYRVTVGETEAMFSSVSGLDMSAETVEYKDGSGDVYRLPGEAQSIAITLKGGTIKRHDGIYDWISSVSATQVDRRDISVGLLDESGGALL